MLFKNQRSLIARFVLILALLSGVFEIKSVSKAHAANLDFLHGVKSNLSSFVPQIIITTPSYPIGMHSRESRLVPYSFTELGNSSGQITSRQFQFFTQYDIPLSEPSGPYLTNISINPLQTTEWSELVYLPESVVNEARAMEEYAIILKTTFKAKSASGATFSEQSSLLILFPPDVFSKSTPASGAVIEPTNQSLSWDSSIGAIDYEYCFDTIDNNSCDTDWTGTYWLGTYDTNASLQNLPQGTIFYWQVRANNTAGTTYANNGTWWTFSTKAASQTVITSDKIDPSRVDQSAKINVTVSGDSSIPTGTVEITGADTNCTITLNRKGEGFCRVSFSSAGEKVLTATYNGDSTYSISSDTEPHVVVPKRP